MKKYTSSIQLTNTAKVVEVNTFDNLLYTHRLSMVHFSESCRTIKEMKRKCMEELLHEFSLGAFGRGIVVGGPEGTTRSYNGSDAFLTGASFGRRNDPLYHGLISGKCPFIQHQNDSFGRFDANLAPFADLKNKLTDCVSDVNQEIQEIMNLAPNPDSRYSHACELERLYVDPVVTELCKERGWTTPDANENPKVCLTRIPDNSPANIEGYRYDWDSCNIQPLSNDTRIVIQEHIFKHAVKIDKQLRKKVKAYTNAFVQLVKEYPITFSFPLLGATVALLYSLFFLSDHLNNGAQNLNVVLDRAPDKRLHIASIKQLVQRFAQGDLFRYHNLNMFEHFKRRLRWAKLFLVLDPVQSNSAINQFDHKATIRFLQNCMVDMTIMNNLTARGLEKYMIHVPEQCEVIVLVLHPITEQLLRQMAILKQNNAKVHALFMNASWLWRSSDLEWFRKHNNKDYKTLVLDEIALQPTYKQPAVFLDQIVCDNQSKVSTKTNSRKRSRSTRPTMPAQSGKRTRKRYEGNKKKEPCLGLKVPSKIAV